MPFHSWITGMLTGLGGGLLEANPLILVAGLIILLIIVFYLVKTLIKTAIVGLFSAFLVVAAAIIGVPVPFTLQSLILAAILGIAIYTILSYLELAFKALKVATFPIRKLAGRKKKEVVVKER